MNTNAVEAKFLEVRNTVGESCSDYARQLEEQIRSAPLSSVGWAVGAGFLLKLFPIGKIVMGLLGLTLALARPALVLLAIFKLVTWFSQKAESSQDVSSFDGGSSLPPNQNNPMV